MLTFLWQNDIIGLALRETLIAISNIGVWLSLARALDLGSRGRRFESCHPDIFFTNSLWWVWRSWLARQIVALEAVGSSPITHLFPMGV